MTIRPDWFDAELFPFESRWVDIDGHAVHYVDEGEGPTLLMLHGNPTWSFLYRDVIDRLRSRFRCVALDYPGFGLSRPAWNYDGAPSSHAAVVERFVLELGLEDVVMVVHDWGGPIGFAVAGRHPDRFRGFVITNSWAWPVAADRRVAGFSRLVGSRPSRALVRRGNLLVNVGLPAGTERRLSGAVMRHYRAPFSAPETRRFAARLPGDLRAADAVQHEAAAALVTLSGLPALIVWGGADPILRSRVRRRFENAFVDHTTWILEDAGHYLHEDAPRDVAAAIDEWHTQRFAEPREVPAGA